MSHNIKFCSSLFSDVSESKTSDSESDYEPTPPPSPPSCSTPVSAPSTQSTNTSYSFRPKSNKRKYVSSDDDSDTIRVFKTPKAKRRLVANASKRKKECTPEQRQRQNEMAKERMRAYRARRKEVSQSPQATRTLVKVQRANWRKEKEDQRKKMSSQKLNSVNKQRRQKYVENKLKQGKIPRTAVKDKQVVILPNTPEKYAEEVAKLIRLCTPRKKQAIIDAGLWLSPTKQKEKVMRDKMFHNVKRRIQLLKSSTLRKDREELHMLVSTVSGGQMIDNTMRRSLQLRWETMSKYSQMEQYSRKTKSTALQPDEIEEVVQFYTTNATMLAGKKTVSKKTGTQKSILTTTTSRLHSEYSNTSQTSLSLGKFRSLRPKSILTVTKQQFIQCLCEYCVNISLKVKALQKAVPNCPFKDKYDVVNATLCPKDEGKEYHAKSCINRDCQNCGVKQISGVLELGESQDDVKWTVWENHTFTNKPKPSNEKQKEVKVIRKVLTDNTTSVSQLVEALEEEVKPFALHLFQAKWQQQQISDLKKNLPPKWMLSMEDFAENFRTNFQDEVQSAHFNYRQATLFTHVSWYHCPTCNHPVEESAVMISPDLVHDAAAVEQFENVYLDHLSASGVDITHHVIASDGAASQFKSKKPFFNLTKTSEENGHTTQRVFFGSRHGKNVCDGLGGTIKSCASTYVRSRNGIIGDAEELFTYCQSNLKREMNCETGQHNPRVFFYVTDIERNNSDKMQTVPNTRLLHDIKSSERGVVEYRQLACFCAPCISRDGDCVNEDQVTGYTKFNLLKGGKSGRKAKKNVKVQKIVRRKRKLSESEMEEAPSPKKTKMARSATKGEKTKQKKTAEKPHKKTCEKKKKKKEAEKSNKNHLYFDGPIPEIKVRQITRSLIHSPFGDKLKECKLIKVQPVIPRNDLSVIDVSGTIDAIALNLLQGLDVPGQQKMPVAIQADGNCMPRVGSFLAYGTEAFHHDMRLRIAMELVLHRSEYLDSKYLSRGHNSDQGSSTSASDFALYSEFYSADLSIEDIYHKEINDILKKGTFMGLWQLFALASVLRCPLFSVFPMKGEDCIRQNHHRLILPRKYDDPIPFPRFIMWSTTRSDMTDDYWVPNHVIPLMPMIQPRETARATEEGCKTVDV